jgi:hypothetical protein
LAVEQPSLDGSLGWWLAKRVAEGTYQLMRLGGLNIGLYAVSHSSLSHFLNQPHKK